MEEKLKEKKNTPDQFGIQWGDRIGKGAFGAVFKCVRNGEEIAVKMMDKGMQKMFQQEIAIMKKIQQQGSHKNLMKLLDIHESPQDFLLVMPLYTGSLKDLIKQRLWKRMFFSPLQMIQIARDMCEGIEYLHKNGIAHRDLKVKLLNKDDSHYFSLPICC